MIGIAVGAGLCILGYAVGKNSEQIKKGCKNVKRNHQRRQVNKKNNTESKNDKKD